MIIKTEFILDSKKLFLNTLCSDKSIHYISNDEDINNDLVSADIRKFKCWEPYQTEITIELLKKLNNKEFIDIGTHIGYYSVICAFYGFNVKSYEKNKLYFDVLEMNVKDYENISVYNQCVDESNIGEAFGDRNIGLIKIDVEGNEPEIIYGMKDFIESKRVDCMIIEISPKFRPIEVWKDLINFLIENEYSIFDIGLSPPRFLDTDTKHLSSLIPFEMGLLDSIGQTNILCIQKNISIK
jgi:hypothetical protein